ncbi:MAG: hypothetical protein M3N29_09370 [Chloroflexota bacterium]|nr:hypothetical protein [Chloroflexota bacterium]
MPAVEKAAASDLMSALAADYTAVTGACKVTPGMRRLLLVCYRIHGEDTVALLRELYGEMGTTVDLLARLRDHPRRGAVIEQVEPDPPALPSAEAEAGALDLDTLLDGVAWVNPPCRLHLPHSWRYRPEGSAVCDICHPSGVARGAA